LKCALDLDDSGFEDVDDARESWPVMYPWPVALHFRQFRRQ